MKITDKMVFSAAVAMNPRLFSTVPREAHQAASPRVVEVVREEVLGLARSALEAAPAAYVGENEPVAWVYTHPVGSVVRFERLAEGARPDLIETPLFTHPATDLVPAPTYQERVAAAHIPLFHDDPTDVAERSARFLEEALETVQAFGMTEEDAIALVRYTFGRPVGDPKLEVGSANLTLASLCVVAEIDLAECAEADLAKLGRPATIDRIRAKRATRHGRGPLPGLSPALSLSSGEDK